MAYQKFTKQQRWEIAKKFTKSAEEKINAAGGKVEVLN